MTHPNKYCTKISISSDKIKRSVLYFKKHIEEIFSNPIDTALPLACLSMLSQIISAALSQTHLKDWEVPAFMAKHQPQARRLAFKDNDGKITLSVFLNILFSLRRWALVPLVSIFFFLFSFLLRNCFIVHWTHL